MKKNITITDNFLPQEQFDAFSELVFSPTWMWNFIPKLATLSETPATSPGQFVHLIYDEDVPRSQYYESHFKPILKLLECEILARIKMNLNHRLPKPFLSNFHMDQNIANSEKLTTSIFYINTNNGYTEFEQDGTKVESVANRLVSFPTNIKHRGVTQTDKQTRVLINFNYLK